MKKSLAVLLVLFICVFSLNISFAETDTTPPTISLNPGVGEIEVGKEVTVTVTDPGKIFYFGYYWDSNEVTRARGFATTVEEKIKVPTTLGTHTLNVCATDMVSMYNTTGWKQYTYTVKSASPTRTPLTVNLSKSGGQLNSNESILVTVGGGQGGVYGIVYSWDNKQEETRYGSTATIYPPKDPGSHTLTIYAKENNVNESSKRTYSFTVLENDLTPPTITLEPNGGNVVAGSRIKFTAYDKNNISQVAYQVGNGTKTILNKYGTNNTEVDNIPVPTQAGSLTVMVYAVDNSNNKNSTYERYYYYTVVAQPVEDKTPPTVKLNKTSGQLNTNEGILVTAEDNQSGVHSIIYYWNNRQEETRYSSTTTIYAPTEPGSHTLTIYVKDNSKNQSSKQTYNFTIIENDTVPPTITLEPNGGNVVAGSRIKLTAYDKNNISKLGYKWSDGTETGLLKYGTNKTETESLLVPSKPGYYTLKVYAIDNHPNKNSTYERYYYYTVVAQPVEDKTPPTFKDISKQSQWALEAINYLYNKGIINGNPDNTFAPQEFVKRNQFAKMLCLALNVNLIDPQTPSFVDVDRTLNWEYKYVETMKSYLTGYKLGNMYFFKGEEYAVREDMAVALVKALKLENEQVNVSELRTIFKDADEISPELQKYVLIASKHNLINGYSDKTFKPKGVLTRAEAASLIYKLIQSEVFQKVVF